jgi:hypothetical protein
MLINVDYTKWGINLFERKTGGGRNKLAKISFSGNKIVENVGLQLIFISIQSVCAVTAGLTIIFGTYFEAATKLFFLFLAFDPPVFSLKTHTAA